MATTKKLFEQKTFEIINESKKKKMGSKYKNSGVITFNKIERIRDAPFSFMDFPMNGTEINVTFAIDFTSSNGKKKYFYFSIIFKIFNMNNFLFKKINEKII